MSIKSVIGKSLFFFGAGASYDAKCLLSQGMLLNIKARISDSQDNTFNSPEKEALKFLLACLEYHAEWRTLETAENFKFSPNIEELALLIRRIKNRENFLPYPITGNWADKLIGLETVFLSLDDKLKAKPTLFESLEYKLKSELLPEWLKPQSYDFLTPLQKFFQELATEDFRLDIFSLNNDMVIENFFGANNAAPWRGFVRGEWRGVEVADVQDLGRINLYKLHGSLDWVRLNTGDFKEVVYLSEQDKESIETQHDPYVIFGQGTKTFSVEPFFSLIQHFKKVLQERNYFFVIGYSFFDPYINNLFLEAVRETSKKIIIINPTFGPEELRNSDKKLETDDTPFQRIKYPSAISSLHLASYIEDIQKNSFYSELPEFNIKRMNAKSLEFLPIGISDFLTSYFANGGDLLVKLIEGYEQDRIEAEEPF